ncbi:hypothetical protein QTI33_16360 [Variovorax sp. J22P271]|uniref:hypothetical protein n=1 Tax=Variovorax davisae TaxID=3053515 RepID=UPI002578EFD6|nr:hypothetical protein [Variovorax sp. J22P271]MDM0033708.1 hypothetical protein [Variovorax sp. J22P271]
MNAIHQPLARTDAPGRPGATATLRGLQKPLMALGVAIAALASAIVLVLNPQPVSSPSQVTLACSGTAAHELPEVAMVRQLSRIARSSHDSPDSQCA